MTCAVVTSPCVGCVWSTPPIVYALVLMFVCGGFSTWRSVCCGVVNCVRSRRRLAGRHLANAPRLGAAEAAAAAVAAEAAAALEPFPLPPPFEPLELLEPRSFAKQACIAAN